LNSQDDIPNKLLLNVENNDIYNKYQQLNLQSKNNDRSYNLKQQELSTNTESFAHSAQNYESSRDNINVKRDDSSSRLNKKPRVMNKEMKMGVK